MSEQRIELNDSEFDLDIRLKMSSRQVDRFTASDDTDSCASTCGDECTNSCASTCEGGCTDTCETCGSCTSECEALGDTSAGCRDFQLFEDIVEVEIGQIRADGVERRLEQKHVLRRVER